MICIQNNTNHCKCSSMIACQISSVNAPNYHKNLHAGLKWNTSKPYTEKLRAQIKQNVFIECTSEIVATMPTPPTQKIPWKIILMSMRSEVIDGTKQHFRHEWEIDLCFKSCSSGFSWFHRNISFGSWLLWKDVDGT